MSLPSVVMCLVMILTFMLMAMAMLDKKGSYMEEIGIAEAIIIAAVILAFAIMDINIHGGN